MIKYKNRKLLIKNIIKYCFIDRDILDIAAVINKEEYNYLFNCKDTYMKIYINFTHDVTKYCIK